MQFKHKELLNEFNRQVQSGEHEKGWWKWEYGDGSVWSAAKDMTPGWVNTTEYRYTMTEKHPDNPLLDVGDIVKSWYFTAVIAKIDNKSNGSEKYFAVITANEGTYGKSTCDHIGDLLDQVVAETREQITRCFDGYEVIKKSK